MKTERFTTGGLYVERTHRREGPSPTFAVCYKGQAWFELNPKKIYKACHLSKGLPSRAAFDEWLDGLDAKKAPQLDMDRVKTEGFGPEAHGLDDADPNHQTKMVT